MLRAVITAGGRVDGAFAAAIGTTTKALAPFGAGVLIDPVLTALRALGITDIAVVGGPDLAAQLGSAGVRHIPAVEEGATNVLAALDAWPEGDHLFLTSDLPFIDAGTLGAFVDASAGYDLTMPLAEGRRIRGRLSGGRRSRDRPSARRAWQTGAHSSSARPADRRSVVSPACFSTRARAAFAMGASAWTATLVPLSREAPND